ncbi:lymphatic vessel endothelial hyaluronic acid receptor 1 isoform X3 [Tachyglossus aculeatus]|uniref:lymphatic vessel endothelial hyaluronic acid receptor 1 isoform X3 n=1 Tax=Tachyglossus aculeatus TaxID=9261 RepID=UPI0018F7CAA1|nr:lymphatic vessel endothelial hyaluronic acid receptor 1 isoform X3 [Tachyglossus aculeatus]
MLRFLTQASFQIRDLVPPECRIMGISLIKKSPGLNFTEGKEACRMLGVQLASKDQVEEARMHGFETCSFGWVASEFLVISRNTANPKCGKNKTGVVEWRVDRSKRHFVYCYNASDTWTDSCNPKTSSITSTEDHGITPTASSAAEYNVTDAAQATSQASTPSPPPRGRRRKLICVTEALWETTRLMEDEVTLPVGSQAAFKNEGVVFGGLPTTLLVLALIFFVAAAVLAVCYVKRYVKTFPFANKNQQKEVIETKTVKKAKGSTDVSEEEKKKNGKKQEDPKMPPKATVKCMEAEV